MTGMPTLTLNTGLPIPRLGFGVFQIPPEDTNIAVTAALEAGYRLIDTVQGYQNEEGVRSAIAGVDVPVEKLFVTTKLTNSEQGYDAALRAREASRARSEDVRRPLPTGSSRRRQPGSRPRGRAGGVELSI